MKKRDLIPMNEMDHKFNKIVIFLLSIENLEFQKCYSIAFDIP